MRNSLVLVDTGGANISSLLFALARLDSSVELSSDPNIISQAKRVILPGVGAAAPIMQNIKSLGLLDCLRNLRQPVLGICVGMQVLFASSSENAADDSVLECLNIIEEPILKLAYKPGFPVPHMGWNELIIKDSAHPLFRNLAPRAYAYFVHSYYAKPSKYSLASVGYSTEIAALVQKDNFYACQFHPEKSAQVGLQLLKNFLELS